MILATATEVSHDTILWTVLIPAIAAFLTAGAAYLKGHSNGKSISDLHTKVDKLNGNEGSES